MMLVVAPIATTLDGIELVEFLFPVSKYMRLHLAEVADLSNGEIALSRNGWELRL